VSIDPDEIRDIIAKLAPAKQSLIADIVARLARPPRYTLLPGSELFTDDFAAGFEVVLRMHHAVSEAPFSKDKFEWGLVQVCNSCGMSASIGPRGLAGYDVEVNGEKWSLKTQADRNIRLDRLHISKFMELGKGRWVDENDLAGLRDRMLQHMTGYDRILSLRHFDQSQGVNDPHMYELVEIPKALLAEAAHGTIEMRHSSAQDPKPGYCTVPGKFQLYFDGGTERKLQIKNLMKKHCIVHVTWHLD